MPTLDNADRDGDAAPNTQADVTSRPGRNPLKRLPLRLHHYASVVKDQEVNRQFFEDILGIPLVATWCERAISGELGIEMEYSHTLYALADGGALAFFQFADQGLYERCKAVPEFGRCIPRVDTGSSPGRLPRMITVIPPSERLICGAFRSSYSAVIFPPNILSYQSAVAFGSSLMRCTWSKVSLTSLIYCSSCAIPVHCNTSVKPRKKPLCGHGSEMVL